VTRIGTSDATRDLAIAALQRLLRSEPRLSTAWKVLARRATHPSLRRLCREGVTYTDRRTRRVRQALKALDAPVRPALSSGMDGLIKDALRAARERDPTQRDAAMLGAIERISHDGLAVYTTIDRYLRACSATEARRILVPSTKEKREAVAEESQMARKQLIAKLRER
jgi:ferritin-like metal-binding protein YciE